MNTTEKGFAFFNALGNAQREGIYINRRMIDESGIKAEGFKLAESGGFDTGLYNDKEELKNCMTFNFSDMMKYFSSESGEIMLDHKHALVMYYVLLARGDKRADLAKALAYYLGAVEITDNLKKIKTKLRRGTDLLDAKIGLSTFTMKWQAIPFVFDKYLPVFMRQDGYRDYYYEKKYVNLIALVMACTGADVMHAEKIVDSTHGSLLMQGLPKDVENALLPYLLSDAFRFLDGRFASKCKELKIGIKAKWDSEDFDVYTMNIKPLLLEFQGAFIQLFRHEVGEKYPISNEDLFISFATPQRVYFKVKDFMNIEEELPNIGVGLRRVEDILVENLLMGDI